LIKQMIIGFAIGIVIVVAGMTATAPAPKRPGGAFIQPEHRIINLEPIVIVGDKPIELPEMIIVAD
jgi:hypothetical protein